MNARPNTNSRTRQIPNNGNSDLASRAIADFFRLEEAVLRSNAAMDLILTKLAQLVVDHVEDDSQTKVIVCGIIMIGKESIGRLSAAHHAAKNAFFSLIEGQSADPKQT